MRPLLPGIAVLLACAAGAKADGASREEKVRADKARVEASGWWIYQDLPRAFEEARTSGKPLVVVLRCVPCEDCVKLDDEVVDTDPRLKPLLERFVRARVVGTNGLDLATFQFDTDQSWLVFLRRETDVLRHALQELAPGARVALRLQREGKVVDVTLTLPR
jgi:hypothetical protein